MAQIEIPFGPGEKAWVVAPEWTKEKQTCPDCAGAKVVRMILGCGDELSLDCRTCRSGYGPPMGYIEQTVCEYVVHKLEVDKFSIDERAVRYVFPGVGVVDCDHMFTTKKAAEAWAVKERQLQQQIEDDRLMGLIGNRRDDQSWDLTYLRRERRKLVQALDVIDSRLDAVKRRNSCS